MLSALSCPLFENGENSSTESCCARWRARPSAFAVRVDSGVMPSGSAAAEFRNALVEKMRCRQWPSRGLSRRRPPYRPETAGASVVLLQPAIAYSSRRTSLLLQHTHPRRGGVQRESCSKWLGRNCPTGHGEVDDGLLSHARILPDREPPFLYLGERRRPNAHTHPSNAVVRVGAGTSNWFVVTDVMFTWMYSEDDWAKIPPCM